MNLKSSRRLRCNREPLETTRLGSGFVTQDHTMTLCHYLLMMIETSGVRTPTCARMAVDEGRTSSAVKWSPAHAEAIETGNGGRCGVTAFTLSNLRILYFPQSLTHPPRSCCHTHTHEWTNVQAHKPSPVLYPLEVRVWYQPICSNHPCNPNSLTSTTPDPRSSFPRFPTRGVCHRHSDGTHQNTLRRALEQHSQRGSERRVKWAEGREAADMKSCSDSRLTDTGVLKNRIREREPLITVSFQHV